MIGKGIINMLSKVYVIVAIVLILIAGLSGYIIGQNTSSALVQTVTVEKTVVRTVTQQVTQQPTEQPQQTIPDKIVVGFTVGLTGPFALASTQGLWGIQAATKWVNDVYGGIKIGGKRVKIELKYYDDQSSKDLVPSLYERLITVDKVDFLLGPYSSPLVYVAAPVTEKYGKLMINWMGASDAIHEQGYRYVVAVLTLATEQMRTAVGMIKQLDPRAKLAIVFKEDEFNRFIGMGARKAAQELGLQVVFFKSYPIDIKDFTPIFTEMAATKPDVIIIGSHETDGILAAKQLSELNINAKMIIMTFVPGFLSFRQALGNLAEGFAGTQQWEPVASYKPEDAMKKGFEWFGPTGNEFLELYKSVAKPGEKPTEHAGAGAAAILVLAKAIEAAQSLDQRAVREALNRLNIMTFFGPFKIDPATGKQIAHEELVAQWQGGKYVVIWPPEVATSKPVYPIPTWDEKRQGKQAMPS
jgi:branched-chain amino acid transport system substrate-binding protein